MKYRTMIKILNTLLTRRKITARELARKYEISLRTVYRYIEDLSVAGIPISVDRGRYGGVTLSDSYKLPAAYFTREEYAAAVGALHAWISQTADANAVDALEKLESRQKTDRQELSVTGNVIVDGGVWGDMGAFSGKMRSVEKALNERENLLIDYISREGEHSKRVIDPYVLILKRNVWYVYAYCHSKQDFRTFKIGRIKQIYNLGTHFERQEITKADIPLDFYYTSDDMTEVTLEIERSAAADAEEWLGVDAIEPRGDKFISEVALPTEGLAGKILSFGGAIKVVSPQSLADEIKAVAARIANS